LAWSWPNFPRRRPIILVCRLKALTSLTIIATERTPILNTKGEWEFHSPFFFELFQFHLWTNH
jgi:hypothetical protein